jgi:hypothetical protein
MPMTLLHRDITARIAKILEDEANDVHEQATHAVIRVIAFDQNPSTKKAYETSITNMHASTKDIVEQLDAASAHERLKIIALVPDVLGRLNVIAGDPTREANQHARSIELTELGQATMIWRSATTAVIYNSMKARLGIADIDGYTATASLRGET